MDNMGQYPYPPTFRSDGEPCSLDSLCRNEPGWAASRLRDLHSQLAAAQSKLDESARLATESAQLADGLAKDLADANERAGRLEGALNKLVTVTNGVTAPHRHNAPISMKHLDRLCEVQLDCERILGGS